MRSFFFRLETILKLRHANVAKLHREHEYALKKLGEWKEKEQTLSQQIEALMEEIRKQRNEKVRALEDTYLQILEHLNHSLANVQMTLASQEKQVLVFQERLARAISARKVIEKIREKHYAHLKNQQEKESDSIDDWIQTSNQL